MVQAKNYYELIIGSPWGKGRNHQLNRLSSNKNTNDVLRYRHEVDQLCFCLVTRCLSCSTVIWLLPKVALRQFCVGGLESKSP